MKYLVLVPVAILSACVGSDNSQPQAIPSSAPIDAQLLIQGSPDRPGMVANQILVRFVDGTSLAEVQAIVGTIDGKIVGMLKSPDIYQIQIPSTTEAQLRSAIQTIKIDSRVLGATPNYQQQLQIQTDIDRLVVSAPDEAWAYTKIQIQEAWLEITNSNLELHPVTVAFIDSGLDSNHVEYKDVQKFGVNADFSNDLQLSDWGDQCASTGHGTLTAGVVGAHNGEGDMNGILAGLPGSRYTLQIYRVGCTSAAPSLSTQSIFAAINEAISNGAQVVNMSFGADFAIGSSDYDGLAENYRTYFNKGANSLFVGSAGNGGVSSAGTLPANLAGTLSNVVSVAATDQTDNRSIWSATGSSNYYGNINLGAPGTLVWAPKRGGGYAGFNGTSLSAPLVSGVAALLLQLDPTLTPVEIKTILGNTADVIQTDKGPWKRLNAKKAVQSVISRLGGGSTTPVLNSIEVGISGDGTVNGTVEVTTSTYPEVILCSSNCSVLFANNDTLRIKPLGIPVSNPLSGYSVCTKYNPVCQSYDYSTCIIDTAISPVSKVTASFYFTTGVCPAL